MINKTTEKEEKKKGVHVIYITRVLWRLLCLIHDRRNGTKE
jgi:hypothetical protein